MEGEVAAGTRAVQDYSLFAVVLPEPRTFRVHDLLTIIVRERKRSASQAKYRQDHEYQLQAKLAAWFRIHDKKWLQQAFQGGTPEVDLDWDEEMNNKGKHEREDLLELRITAEIVDVKPNGSLVLEATKEITTDDNIQIMKLTGTCRAGDVSADNTVLSTQVAELAVSIHNPGSIRDATKRGWLLRLFDVVRPF
jgi:flagellar L-ring protein precursor FlgH